MSDCNSREEVQKNVNSRNSLRGRFNLLRNDAAKHKIAIKPRKNHPRNRDKNSQSDGAVTPINGDLQSQRNTNFSSSYNEGKKPPRKSIISKGETKGERNKWENGKNFGFLSRLLKSKQWSSKEPEDKRHVRGDSASIRQSLVEPPSVNVRSITYKPGRPAQCSSHSVQCDNQGSVRYIGGSFMEYGGYYHLQKIEKKYF